MNLSDQELDIIRVMRQMVPFEEIRIIKDQEGRSDHYFVVRTQKIVISKMESKPVRLL